jgi:uncharacterized protein
MATSENMQHGHETVENHSKSGGQHNDNNTRHRGENNGQEESRSKPAQKNSHRGFAAMDPQQQQAIARKGGHAVSQNREHMARIGKKGGEAVSRDRVHMAEIGQKGGESRQSKNENKQNNQ